MSGSRFENHNSAGSEPDPCRDSTVPSADMLSELKAAGKILPVDFKSPKAGDTAVDQELLDALKEFVRRRYSPPKFSQNDIHIDTTGNSAESVSGDEWKNAHQELARDLMAMKVNDYAHRVYTTARFLAEGDGPMRIAIGDIENAALDLLNNKVKIGNLPPHLRSAAWELMTAAEELSGKGESDLINMNTPQVNAKYICRVADYLLNFTPELKENAHIVLRFTGEHFEATVHGFGDGAKKYLLEVDNKELDRLKGPAFSRSTDTIISLGDFAATLSKINGGAAPGNVIAFCRAAISDVDSAAA